MSTFPPMIYLDTGEIFVADDEGCPTEKMVAVIAGEPDEAEAIGQLLATAPKLLAAADGAALALGEAAALLSSQGFNGCASIMRNHAAIVSAAVKEARGQ